MNTLKFRSSMITAVVMFLLGSLSYADEVLFSCTLPGEKETTETISLVRNENGDFKIDLNGAKMVPVASVTEGAIQDKESCNLDEYRTRELEDLITPEFFILKDVVDQLKGSPADSQTLGLNLNISLEIVKFAKRYALETIPMRFMGAVRISLTEYFDQDKKLVGRSYNGGVIPVLCL